MIAEYVDQVRNRLNIACRANDGPEINRLSLLLGSIMIDAEKTGETMPWDTHCPLCGSARTSAGDGT